MKYHQAQSGFTLVETLVAITILLIVIVGPLTISTSTARSTTFSTEQVTAFFLAQEGAELAQKAYNDLLLSNLTDSSDTFKTNANDAWAEFTERNLPFNPSLYGLCYVTDCNLEMQVNSTVGLVETLPFPCGGSNSTLRYNPSGERNRYSLQGSYANATQYSRCARFEHTLGSDEVKVTSRVFWRSGFLQQEQEVVVETFIFNAYGQ